MATITRLHLPPSPFLRAVLRSELLTPDDLFGVLSGYDPAQVAAAEPLQLATFLVRKKLLTRFQAMQLLAGRTNGFRLGRYTIREGVREDRVGMTFLADDAGTGQTVALKVLPTDRVADGTVYRPFLAEVRAAAKVGHAAVARVLDLGLARNTNYVVTEHVAAPTLDRVVADGGPLPPGRAARVVAQAAAGLAAAHAAGLVHRDVKPQNLALLPDGRVKLLDLGLTHLLDNPWGRATRRLHLPEYAAEIAHVPPEQAWGCGLDARSDVYGLGSTAYFLLTGRVPFLGSAAEAMTARQLRGVPAPSAARAGVPPGLDRLVQKLGAKDPPGRFQTAAEVVWALRPWVPVAEWVGLGLPLDRPAAAAPPPARPRSGLTGTLARLLGR
ncbi:MAG: serine/threonine protein kinase [Gemmataceae bacterium]|nr:serine/threonine protein kinase [Gemmataceae bacterium]